MLTAGASSPPGRRAGVPAVPNSPVAASGLASEQAPAERSLLGLVSREPVQFLPVPIFDTRR